MQKLIFNQYLALVEFMLVLLSGAVWVIKPEWGIWFILIVLLLLVSRVFFEGLQFNALDWLVLVFVLTAWMGYWAAYDQATAWNKAWLIVIASLMYFSLKWQPKQNLLHISVFLFCVGVGVSLYYFLTHDFIALPRKIAFVNEIGRWMMSIRPQTGWMPIHPNYVAGVIVITVPFILYPLLEYRKKNSRLPYLFILAVSMGLGSAGFALVMTTSRGVFFAIASGVGGWLLWRLGNNLRIMHERFFPILLFAFLSIVVIFLYIGPARSGSLFTGNYYYGNGSRAELFSRSIYLLFAFPITGGGLASFPGLYSQYLLEIPFYNVPNSHNLFLDVGLEQGLFGGLSFLFIYLTSLWVTSRTITHDNKEKVFKWIVLFSITVAIVHGMVDNYLYNGVGTILSLLLPGFSMNLYRDDDQVRKSTPNFRTISAIAFIWILVAFANLNQIRAIWHANIGAVKLAKVELEGFPDAGWAGVEIVPSLNAADASLRSALQFDPTNRSANQRLGLIYMYRRDFSSAIHFFEIAHAQAPNHRGIIKSLAYCYTWLGDLGKAEEYLLQVPEAQEELDVYIRWWDAQGRSDLSNNASLALNMIESIK